MENSKRAFIAKPHFFKPETQIEIIKSIEYTDVYTYVALRSFNKDRYKSCFPALTKIAERAGTSKKFITSSIARLESSGVINVLRSGKLRIGNRYTFRKFQDFDRIPYQLFECTELSLYEKSILLCLREIAITPNDINGTVTELSNQLGLTYKTLYCQLKSLISKGYIESRTSTWHRFKKIDWMYVDKRPEEHICTKYLFDIGETPVKPLITSSVQQNMFTLG